jgi:hypothetical protein
MKTIKELQDILLHNVGQRLISYGFNPKPKGQDFFKKADFGLINFHLSFSPHRTVFVAAVNVALRLDKLEFFINPKDKKSFSIGAELGNLKNWSRMTWTISPDCNMDEVAASMCFNFVEYGVPFIEKYCSLENVYEVISQNDRQSGLLSPLTHVRAIQSVALALLLNKSESELETLIEREIELFKDKELLGLDNFCKFVKEKVPFWENRTCG